MSKEILLLFIAIISAITVKGQSVETTDSINRKLEELTVEATAVIRKADKSVYSINNAIKERSSSALEVLKNLQIPTLSVNELFDQVSSSLGPVQIRINGREVDAEKLKTINLQDIQKIEWIDNPSLRYGTEVGAVLNFIVRNPDSGGSLNIVNQESLTMWFNNYFGNLTLNSGRSQWTLGAWGNFRDHLQMYREYSDKFKLADGTTLERTQKPLDGYYNFANISPSLSYNYVIPDTTNLYVGLTVYNGIKNEMFYDGILNSSISRNDESTRLTEIYKYPYSLIPSLNVYWEQKIRGDQNLIVNTWCNFNRGGSNRSYIESVVTDGEHLINVENHIRNRSYSYEVEGNYIKNWEQKGQLTVGLQYIGSEVHSNFLDYDNLRVKQSKSRIYFFGEYSIQVKKFNFNMGVGGTWNKNYIHGETSHSTLDFTPRLSVNWRATDQSRFNLTYNNWVVSPTIDDLSPVTQTIDGFQIERGNPDLRPFLRHNFKFSYNYANNKNFNISSFISFEHVNKPIFTYYAWEGDKILRTQSNEGLYNALQWNVSASWQPIKEWMSLSASLNYKYVYNRGHAFKHSLHSWGEEFDFSVFHWNWNLNFTIYKPFEYLWGETLTRGEFFNSLSLGYKWKNWKFDLMVYVPFGKYNQVDKVISNLVSQETIMRSKGVQHMPVISIRYNINWGRQKTAAQRKLGSGESAGGATAAGR